MEQDIDKVARALRTEPFASMLAADRELYEKCLDTPRFAYAFGQAAIVCKHAPALVAEVERMRGLLREVAYAPRTMEESLARNTLNARIRAALTPHEVQPVPILEPPK